MFKKTIFLLVFLGLFVASVSVVYGQGNILPTASGTVPPSCKNSTTTCKVPAGSNVSQATYYGDYSLNDFVSLAINISKWILGIVGSLALIMFIYGGLMFLISAGSADSIAKAKKIIVAAVVGLIIVFASFLIIKFVMRAMGLDWNGKISKPGPITLVVQRLNII